MAIWNLGSINIDIVYDLPHIPAPGETLSSTARRLYLGGKGVNMSVAAARAGAVVHHIGAVGEDGGWTEERLAESGVDTAAIARLPGETGHAVIAVATGGENAIILHPGANRQVSLSAVEAALGGAQAGDWFVTQNETNGQAEAAKLARSLGLRVAYAAAPFDAAAVQAVLPYLDFLILNAVEAKQLAAALGQEIAALPVRDIIVTRGEGGADWIETASGAVTHVPALSVTPVDTTGAGDTFTGYVLAGLDRGDGMADAMELAGRAAALKVTRHGTSDVIPTLEEVRAFAP